jgi:hypothetical protein
MPSFRDMDNAAMEHIHRHQGKRRKAGIFGGGVDADPLSPFDLTFHAKKDWRVEFEGDDECLQ